MVSDPTAIEVCQDKRLFIEFCLRHGFSVPKTYETKDKIFDFPVFARDRFGKGSKSAFLVNSEAELDYFLKHSKEPIVQEYIKAPEYTVDLFADFSSEVLSVVPRERLSIFGGESFIGRTCKNWDIINEAIRMAKALNLVGPTTIQCFWQDGRVKFIEVNPRYGGAANLGFAAGAFTPRMLVRLVSGKEVKPCVGEFKDNLYMLRYTEDIFVDEDKMRGIKYFAESNLS
jgi:carbamoyl-phosphate synthase large subunit